MSTALKLSCARNVGAPSTSAVNTVSLNENHVFIVCDEFDDKRFPSFSDEEEYLLNRSGAHIISG